MAPPPTSVPPPTVPAAIRASVKYCRELGKLWTTSWSSTTSFLVLEVSTTGDSAVTVMVSATLPTRNVASASVTADPDTITSSRFTVLKPVSVNVTV